MRRAHIILIPEEAHQEQNNEVNHFFVNLKTDGFRDEALLGFRGGVGQSLELLCSDVVPTLPKGDIVERAYGFSCTFGARGNHRALARPGVSRL